MILIKCLSEAKHDFDVHKDFYWDRDLKYRHALYLFKCHECHTLYEALRVVTSYCARVLERGN